MKNTHPPTDAAVQASCSRRRSRVAIASISDRENVIELDRPTS
jgi:hypothetical protein